jgi:hypothetical protein
MLRVFFFERLETSDLLLYETIPNSLQYFNQYILKYIFQTAIDVIESQAADITSVIFNMVEFLYDTLIRRNTIDVVKFSKSLTIEAISMIKKLFIFLREQESLM